ncbi:MAG TPA: hypothetical protein VFR07_03465 [Mycobacteriales bacterium]|jgi:hypothetical protein|nr:hypothetical protein [Mycobacteriales bacterium]
MTEVTYAVIARVPPHGVQHFQEYEDAVLALLPAHGGRLDRRVRSADGILEIHLVVFDSADGLERFRSDPRRLAAAGLLHRSGAELELTHVTAAP